MVFPTWNLSYSNTMVVMEIFCNPMIPYNESPVRKFTHYILDNDLKVIIVFSLSTSDACTRHLMFSNIYSNLIINLSLCLYLLCVWESFFSYLVVWLYLHRIYARVYLCLLWVLSFCLYLGKVHWFLSLSSFYFGCCFTSTNFCWNWSSQGRWSSPLASWYGCHGLSFHKFNWLSWT